LFRGSAPAPPVVKHKAGPPKKEGVYNWIGTHLTGVCVHIGACIMHMWAEL
jgi:hypothetical protein